MQTRVDDAKHDLLLRAAKVGHSTDPERASFLERFYRHVAAQELVGRDPVDICGAALSHRALAEQRPQGTAGVRVFTPTVEEQGWSSGHTVVEVVTDDMPFLVDSVSAALNQHGRSIHLVVHPQLVVRRTITGDLVEVTDLPAGSSDDHELVTESWIHVEIDRESDPDELAGIEAMLHKVLRDVRESVEDWTKMRESAMQIADQLAAKPPVGIEDAEVSETFELLRWLADEHFTFLGYREYSLEQRDGEDVLRAVAGSGLGILRADQDMSHSFSTLPPEVRAKAREPKLLVLTKANSRSTVHRSTYLDYVGVKLIDDEGAVVGEKRFLGLFTSPVYTESVLRIPVLRRKAREVLEMSGFATSSHSGKDLMQILETYPREELFQVPTAELFPIAMSVLHLQGRRQVRLFVRRDDYSRYVSALVYLPRDRYTTTVRQRMEAILRDAFDGATVDYTARVTESVLARVHFVVRVPRGADIPDVDLPALEARLVDATRSWNDDFSDALLEQLGEEQAARFVQAYGDAFPEAYKEDFPARVAVADLKQLEALASDGDLGMNLYTPYGADPGTYRFKLYRIAEPVSLSEVLPLLSRMGVEVVDERPYSVERRGASDAWVYDFGLRADTKVRSEESTRARFQDAFAAVWSGRAESDGFNALVLGGGLAWREVAVLRAYAKYLRQTGSTFSQEYVENCLRTNVTIARLVVQLFRARFDPEDHDQRDLECKQLEEKVLTALDDVASLDQDRILRSYLALVQATLRTNWFQTDDYGDPKAYTSFKLDSQAVPDLPAPRPRFEIWVYSPRVEGVHLRFGMVARGGLRWSDRREDFRTEVLGLVKAQAVKNAVIVPVGAKGGFVVKRPSDPADREAFLAEGIACYKTFISGLLDITDNLVTGKVEPPIDVVRHDGDDAYLVVAADKGTATFSDIANSVALDYGFWLGDAFASGGSAGYDHKAMGITARGAWESVKRHFRELGVNSQTQDFTVVGVGDMSGDVFGNGMLLSEHIRLLAAFDHRHVFLDPSPDAAISYAERRRLFDLPRSSWEDYDTSLISEGGGVYARALKAVPISPHVAAVLGLPDSLTTMTPAELMKAILQAPVDLLWNGGIGTYVKASTESHTDVGDKANDSIRVNGADLSARVVGEGGNLGLTQLGRVEAALKGVKLNTDAIDNSAGVDTSDHEVNIKILLDEVVRSGDMTSKQRNEFLAAMTDDVGRMVLRDNDEQNVVLGNARAQAYPMLTVHQRFIRSLEQSGALDRRLEFLPDDLEISERAAANIGLTSPEFAMLVAYSKMTLAQELLDSELPDEPWYQNQLRSYFPPLLVEKYDHLLESHPLRREIITTCVVNSLVNHGGMTFVFRAVEETGASPVQIARAYTVARRVFGVGAYDDRVERLDNQVPTATQDELFLEGRRLIDRATRWILQNRRSLVDVSGEIEHFGDVAAMIASIPDWLRGAELERLRRRVAEFEAMGAPSDLAVDAASMLDSFSLLDVVEIAARTGETPDTVGPLYYALSERFEVDAMLSRITGLPREDRWSALARMALRYDLYTALSSLTASVIAATPDMKDPDARIAAWEEANAEGLERTRTTLTEIASGEQHDLATLSVALRVLRTLVPAGAPVT